MELDPDYDFDISQDSVEEVNITKQFEDDAREAVKEKICTIIKQQFAEEISLKEKEVMVITKRLKEARHMLDRLRACVVASYYASSFAKPQEKHILEPGAAHHPAIQNILRKAATAVLSQNTFPEHTDKLKNDQASEVLKEIESEKADLAETKSIDDITRMSESTCTDAQSPRPLPCDTPIKNTLGGRHRVKKTIIVGNVSKYIPPEKREGNDKSSHKWMVYVRGSADKPRIDHFVRKVWFFLHPSYRPNDLVEISEAPFHLTRRGWGEFPIRVQLHFCDPRNRRVDIIHNLRLDRTYTGLQTLGAETVCEVELDQCTIGLPVENLLSQSVEVTNTANTTEEELSNDIDKDHAGRSISKEVDSIIHDLLTNIENNVDGYSSVDEEMYISADEVAELDVSSTSTERRRKRRRGDSATISDSDRSKLKHSSSIMVICPDDDNVIERTEEGSSHNLSQKLESEMKFNGNTSNEINPKENQSGSKHLEESSSKTIIPNLTSSIYGSIDTQNNVCSIESLSGNAHIVPNSLPSSPCKSGSSTPKSASPTEQLSVDQKSFERPRSLSLDAVSQLSLSLTDNKVVRLKKSPAETRQSIVHSTSSSVNKPSIVVLRSRSSSTGQNHHFAQNNKGNITFLTPISTKVSKSADNPNRKRSIAQLSTHSNGKIVLNLVPEKQRKLSSGDPSRFQNVSATSHDNPAVIKKSQNTSVATPNQSSAGKITLTIGGTKQEIPILTTVGTIPVQIGTSGSVICRPKVKTEVSSLTTKPQVPKQRSVCVINQKPANNSNKPTNFNIGSSTAFLPISHNDIKKHTTQLGSQPQLVTLKPIKSSLPSGNGCSSQPQIKIEKPSGLQTFTQLKSQQFVLTTVTNDKGKHQLALVSTDKFNQISKSKNAETMYDKVASLENVCLYQPVKLKPLSQSATPHLLSKVARSENLPYYKVVANRILSRRVTDLIKEALPLAVKLVPLVASDRNIIHLPFCAKTEAEFLEWNIGKQRAAEWQRASLIQKVLKDVAYRSDRIKEVSPSKRFIINWCLKRGYSVFTDEFEVDVSEEENKRSHVEVQRSLTEQRFLEDLILFSNDYKRSDENVEIDIIAHSPTHIENKSNIQDQEKSKRRKINFLRTNSMKAVELLSNQIGVKLEDVSLADDVAAPLTHVVLAEALRRFVDELAREMLVSTLTRRDGEKHLQRVLPMQIECCDVSNALTNHEHFNILTDHNMGIPASSNI